MKNILKELFERRTLKEKELDKEESKLCDLENELEGYEYTLENLNDAYDYLDDAIYSLDNAGFDTFNLEDAKDDVYREIEEYKEQCVEIEEEIEEVKDKKELLKEQLQEIINHINSIKALIVYCGSNNINFELEEELLIELGLGCNEIDKELLLD